MCKNVNMLIILFIQTVPDNGKVERPEPSIQQLEVEKKIT